ncbi:MAG TPA: alpha/beta hydrolase, partial [Kouleothrix sp.]|nr:alpha/beta hydrolase [Kouleothrix sp.]
GITQAVLVGHSLGAAIAQRTAIAWPDLAERLVLIDGGLPIEPRQPPPVLWLFLTPGLGEAFYTSLRRSQQGAYDTLRPYYYNLDALPEAERAFLRERVWARVWSSSQRRAFLSTLRWLAIEQVFRAGRYRARLATATTPTTILWGSNDLIAPQAAGAAMAALLPRATLQIIAESGHNVQHEQPQELVRLIEHVLTK